GSNFAGQFSIESLIDRGEHAAREQPRDQVLGADVKFFGEIFDTDAFGDGDVPRDRQRLVGEREPGRWNKALHRAFFHTSRNVSLAQSQCWTPGTGSRTRGDGGGRGRAATTMTTHGAR